MDEIEKFLRKADEAQELFNRLPAAYPAKRDLAALKARWEAGDKTVIKYIDEDEDGGAYYRLEFTEKQQAELIDAYISASPKNDDRSKFPAYLKRLRSDADVFVRILQGWADGIEHSQNLVPDNQKSRERVFDSLGNAFAKLDQSLSELDSEALGYWYAHVVDALAKSGIQLSSADNQLTSMLDHPLRAVVEGGELRKDLRQMIKLIVQSTITAKESLPKYDRVENDIRLRKAKALERLVIEHGLPFDTSETGYPAACLRAIFDLAGLEVEKVSYWLKKAEDDPDSFAKFVKRMKEKT
jgi:hypothetical protein